MRTISRMEREGIPKDGMQLDSQAQYLDCLNEVGR